MRPCSLLLHSQRSVVLHLAIAQTLVDSWADFASLTCSMATNKFVAESPMASAIRAEFCDMVASVANVKMKRDLYAVWIRSTGILDNASATHPLAVIVDSACHVCSLVAPATLRVAGSIVALGRHSAPIAFLVGR